MLEQVIKYIDSHEDEMLDLWRQLVQIESPSNYKAGVDAVGKVIADYCTSKLGYYIRYLQDDQYGNCLAACSCPFSDYKNGIAISAHMDTVHAIGAFDPILGEDEDYLYGPGAGDCKGGIVMAILIASALKEIGYSNRPIKLLFAADEESGGPTGPVFYNNELKNTAFMFNAESGIRNKVVTGRKSSLIAEFDISGQAAHIGYLHDKPKSAIREAALKLLALEDASDYDMLTFCGGKIQGGTVATSVPDQCKLQVNVRIKDACVIDKAIEILERTAKETFVPGTKCELTIRGNRTPMSERQENIDLCYKFSEASVNLGFRKIEPAFVGGASDAAHASSMGIPVICATGPVVDYQHTLQERVLKSSMIQRAKIHASVILNLQ